ncbi:hypothetical protein DFP72DRAFT_859190 [Ephemerocybe angulata]|uniref:Uncharacterized protein n=1 Tax=Ephemerocybe angulata TaxID=980116 RepID=A0A8H6LTH0_9AGAR|nr:hypothetical protein DFP72DRAFT_859190 [Tulosesus angulatus]
MPNAIDVDAEPVTIPLNLNAFLIVLMRRNRDLFDRKLFKSLQEFHTAVGGRGAALRSIVGDMVRETADLLHRDTEAGTQYDCLRVRKALLPFGDTERLDRDVQAELAIFVHRMSFAHVSRAPIDEREEARVLAVELMDKATMTEIIRQGRPNIDDLNLADELHMLFRWAERFAPYAERIEERGREIDGDEGDNRFGRRMTRGICLEFEELDARFRGGDFDYPDA